MGQFHLKRVISILFLATTGLLTACTRNVPDKVSLNIAVPNSLNAMTNEKLDFVIINGRMDALAPDPQRVWSFDGPFNAVAGGSFQLVIEDNIPTSTKFLVQFLGGFRDPQGGIRFAYGDTTVDTSKSGDVTANIAATIFGTSVQEARVAGRYKTTANPNLSGELITYFPPPLINGVQRPLMAVDKSAIFNGWFSAILLDDSGGTASKLIYKVRDAETHAVKEVLFNANGFALSDFSSGLNTTSTYEFGKIKFPAGFRRSFRYDSAGLATYRRAMSAREFVFGFFGDVMLSTEKGVYPATTVSVVPGLFQDASFQVPISYLSGGPSTTAIGPVSGFGSPTPGTTEFADFIRFRLDKIEGGGDEMTRFLGFYGPFQQVDANLGGEGYFVARVDYRYGTNPAQPYVNLYWNYLPGVFVSPGNATNAIDGVRIYAKYSPYGDGGGGGHDEPCDIYAQNRGYLPYVDKTNGEISHVAMTVPNSAVPFSTNNSLITYVGNYHYLICPFKSTTAGTKVFFSQRLETHCLGRCGDEGGFGDAVNGVATISSGTISGAGGSQRGSSARVLGASTNIATGLTTINYDFANYHNMGGVGPGDEIMIQILASRGANACGTYLGDQLSYGRRIFARVVSNLPGSGYLTIPYGTEADAFSDSLITPTNLNAAATSATFCYAQIVKVLNFQTLDITGPVTADPFNGFDNYGGGAIAIRVYDTLNFQTSGSLSASNQGFRGGFPSQTGHGIQGSNPTDGNSTGGFFDNSAIAGGGGGGFSFSGGPSAGNGGVAQGGGLIPVSNPPDPWSTPFLFGGGGGSPSGGSAAGAGGGLVYVMARKIITNSAPTHFSASGEAGVMSGGGGGGVIIVQSNSIDTTTNSGVPLRLEAFGGGGGSSTAGSGGGAGGYIANATCTTEVAKVDSSSTVFGGAGGPGSPAGGSGTNGVMWLNLPALGCGTIIDEQN